MSEDEDDDAPRIPLSVLGCVALVLLLVLVGMVGAAVGRW